MNLKESIRQMKVYKLSQMFKGWFIGNFEPTLFKTNEVEVGVKIYKAGEYEPEHFHKVAIEFTVIISGSVEMNGQIYQEGDILKVDPFDSTDFRAITDTQTVVVKIPGVNNDKYIVK